MNVDTANSVFEAVRTDVARDIDTEELCEALEVIVRHFQNELKGISMRGVRGAPDWLGHETALWQASEDLRKFVQKRKDIRGKNILLDCFKELAEDQTLGKGRQNLVLILGQYGGPDYSEVLGKLLFDKDVYGHAIKALSRARSLGSKTR